MCYEPVIVGYDKLDNPIKASCRRCIECRQARANEWALRCSFELKDYENSSFITLTYRENPTILIKEDLQKFIKRLRKKIEPIKIKYFSCGEYGDKKLRPHFHLIIFGYDFKDKMELGKSKKEKMLYGSKELQDLWGKGLCTIQDVNAQVVRYVSLYNNKTKKKGLPKHLWEYPEFNTMSQGMGVNQINKKIDTYIKTDEIYLDGFAYKIPNLILNKLDEKKYKKELEEIKQNRFKKRSKTDLETKKRLATKKRMWTKQREL